MTGQADAASTAVLFDMDGLLIDSEPLWLQVETAVMARLGAEWTEADQYWRKLDQSVVYCCGAKRSSGVPTHHLDPCLSRKNLLSVSSISATQSTPFWSR